MVFNVRASLDAIESVLKRTGYFGSGTQQGEPKSPPAGDLYAAIWMDSVGVSSLTLNGTVESHVITVRIYRRELQEPGELAEDELSRAVLAVQDLLMADVDLGGAVRNVDVGGQTGQGFGVEFGHIEMSGVKFRVADMRVPLIVDDSAALVA